MEGRDIFSTYKQGTADFLSRRDTEMLQNYNDITMTSPDCNENIFTREDFVSVRVFHFQSYSTHFYQIS